MCRLSHPKATHILLITSQTRASRSQASQHSNTSSQFGFDLPILGFEGNNPYPVNAKTMKQILGVALGVCSGPKGPVIDLPMFGEGLEAASSREGLGGSHAKSIWRPTCPFGGLGGPEPLFGDRPIHLEGWPPFGDRPVGLGGPRYPFKLEGWGPLTFVHWETLSVWWVGGPCPFEDQPCPFGGWGGPHPLSISRPPCPCGGLALVHLETVLSIWRVLGAPLSIWRPPCPPLVHFKTAPVRLEGWELVHLKTALSIWRAPNRWS